MDHFITNYNIECPPGAVSAVLEDSIMQKGRPVTAGSKILENFVSPIDATVVARLEAAEVTILGKTKMDEFGIAGLLPGSNANDSGAVSAVADGAAVIALCNDYSGAVRKQAVERGVCYIHPTYGTVSRYGLIPAVLSMDQIGVVCKTPDDGFRALSVIAGFDPKDGAMLFRELSADDNDKTKPGSGRLKLGVPVNAFEKAMDSTVVAEFARNFMTVDFELKYFDVYAQVMRILCFAEISSNLTRYDGIKFGYRAGGYGNLHELYTKSRTEALGTDAKLASMLGAMILAQGSYDKYYDKAMRIRRLIKDSLDFEKFDMIVMPATGVDPDDRIALHALPQLCGLPAITVPYHGSGITLIAAAGKDVVLFEALKAVTL